MRGEQQLFVKEEGGSFDRLVAVLRYSPAGSSVWNGIALHGGPLPGYAASHGCVRMPYDFAEKLFDKTRIGMRVIISPNDAAPIEFSHPALFVPNAEAVAAAAVRAEPLAREAAEAAKTADAAKKNAPPGEDGAQLQQSSKLLTVL